MTGDQRLNTVIGRFLDCVVVGAQAENLPVRSLADPAVAAGECATVAWQFSGFARAHGLKLSVLDTTPERLGYDDRPLRGVSAHTVNVFVADETYAVAVDFTASQYGYTALPLCSIRQPDGSWRHAQLAAAA